MSMAAGPAVAASGSLATSVTVAPRADDPSIASAFLPATDSSGAITGLVAASVPSGSSGSSATVAPRATDPSVASDPLTVMASSVALLTEDPLAVGPTTGVSVRSALPLPVTASTGWATSDGAHTAPGVFPCAAASACSVVVSTWPVPASAHANCGNRTARPTAHAHAMARAHAPPPAAFRACLTCPITSYLPSMCCTNS